eukprot:jgi/Orpsp1_1/1190565/evm.model.d7180000079801.3
MEFKEVVVILENEEIPTHYKLTYDRIILNFNLYYLMKEKKGNVLVDFSKAQTIINRGLYWSYGFKSRNSNISLYDITRELKIPPLSGICALAQLRCFRKWKNSLCIIESLVNKIPRLSHSYWTKECRSLEKKLNGKSNIEIKEFYWERDLFNTTKAKKAIIYKKMILDLQKKFKS